MRTATEDMAAKFLRQTGNTLSLLVQFNPEGRESNAEISKDLLYPVNMKLYIFYLHCYCPCDIWVFFVLVQNTTKQLIRQGRALVRLLDQTRSGEVDQSAQTLMHISEYPGRTFSKVTDY